MYAIRTVLCTATNATLHERFLSFQRRRSAGTSFPSWLSKPETVFLKQYVRYNKILLRHPDEKQSAVSLKDLARTDVLKPDIAYKEGF